MNLLLAPLPQLQFIDNGGRPMVGAQLYTYLAGTSTPAATYGDSTGTAPNANPVVCDAGGRASVWLDPNIFYKFILKDSTGNVIYSVDNIGANGGQANVATVASMAALKALVGINGQVVLMEGYNTANDGGGGMFLYNISSSTAADDGMVIAPNSAIGRWFRLAYGYVDVKWYGAVGNGVIDDYNAIASANTYAAAKSWPLLVGAGNFYLGSDPAITAAVQITANTIITASLVGLNFPATISDKAKHFVLSGSGTVILSGDMILPEWFGAKGDGSLTSNTPGTDDTVAIQLAINCAKAGQAVVLDASKKYWARQLTLASHVILKGSQPIKMNNVITPPSGDTAGAYRANLQYNGAAGQAFLSLGSASGGTLGCVVSNLIIDGNALTGYILYLGTYGSIVKDCVLRNGGTGIGVTLTGAAYSGSNIVVGCVFDTMSTGVSNSGAGSIAGVIDSCTFLSCTADIALATIMDGTGLLPWIVRNCSGQNGNVNITHRNGCVITGDNFIMVGSAADLAAKAITYQNTILGATEGNYTEAEILAGWGDNNGTHSENTDLYNRKSIIRAAGGTDVLYARLHDALGKNLAYNVPRVSDRAWYERGLDGVHRWGDQATELMSLDASGNLSLTGKGLWGNLTDLPVDYIGGGHLYYQLTGNLAAWYILSSQSGAGQCNPTWSATLPIDDSLSTVTTFPRETGVHTVTITTGKQYAPGQCIAITTLTKDAWLASVSPYWYSSAWVWAKIVSYNSGTGSLTYNTLYSTGTGTIVNGFILSAWPWYNTLPHRYVIPLDNALGVNGLAGYGIGSPQFGAINVTVINMTPVRWTWDITGAPGGAYLAHTSLTGLVNVDATAIV